MESNSINSSLLLGEENILKEELLNTILNTTSNPMWLLKVNDLNTYTFVLVNPTFYKVTSYQPEQVIGKPMEDVVPKENCELVKDKYKQAVMSKNQISYFEIADLPNGQRTAEITISPIVNKQGEVDHLLCNAHNITELKEAKETINQLEFHNSQLVDFTHIISHNLRAPLSNLSSLVKLLNSDDFEANRAEILSNITFVTKTLEDLFNEILESIKVQQDDKPKTELIPIKSTLDHELNIIKENDIDFEITYDIDDPNVIDYSPSYFRSICHNLLSNAFKYRDSERKLVIKVSTFTNDKGEPILKISDNGIGIDMEKHSKSLFKLGKTFHSHPMAKGFGLFMTKNQVETMGGNISVESEVDRGTTFTINLKNAHN